MRDATQDGKIRVPTDLDSVTAIGEEDHSEIDGAAAERIWQAARHWYRAGMHPALQLCIRRHGRVVLNRAIGHGWGNAPTLSLIHIFLGFPGPNGVHQEIYVEARRKQSPLQLGVRGGFVTGDAGMGHVAIATKKPHQMRAYYNTVFDARLRCV